jgi:peptide/nickel transport system substrate-binding protein
LEQYLDQIGITVKLKPQSIEVGLGTYRAGTEPMGLWFWGPDYPDPSDYIQFGPGYLVGLRAGWTAPEDPSVAALAKQAAITTGTAARQAVFEKYQRAMNASGPFIPLLQPAEVVVGTRNIKNLQSNGLWLVDLRNLG